MRWFGDLPEVPLRQRSIEFDYDDRGNVKLRTSATTNGTKDQVENVFEYPNGDWPIARVTTSYQRSARTTLDPWLTRTTTFGYDDHHLVTDVIAQPGGDLLEEHTTYKRDPKTGIITDVTRTAQGELARHLQLAYDATGTYVEYATNDLGHAAWSKFEPTLGVPTVSMDANGVSTQFVHDGLGRVRQIIPAGASNTDLSYQLESYPGGTAGVVTTQLRAGAETLVRADEAGRPIERCASGFDGQLRCTVTKYDLLGRVYSVTRPALRDYPAPATITTFDSLNRPLGVSRPGGGTLSYTQWFLRTDVWDGAGGHTLVRDLDDRVIESTDVVDSTAITTSYGYAEFDNLASVQDAEGNDTRAYYDARGRRFLLSDPDGGLTYYNHNGFGEVTSSVLPVAGTSTTLLRDQAGRVKQITDPDGVTIYEWDTSAHGVGRIGRAVNADGTIETIYDYDEFGRSLKTTWTIDGSDSYTIGTTWDLNGRLTGFSYPEVPGWPKVSAIRSYNGVGWVDDVSVSFDSGPFSVSGDVWKVGGRDDDGALSEGQLVNGLKTERTPDPMGRTDLLSWYGGEVELHLDYDYDLRGNVIGRNDTASGRVETFGYDEVSRLRSWTLTSTPSQSANVSSARYNSYTFDPIGNMKHVTVDNVLVEDNHYYAGGRPHALDNDGFGASFQYDPRGRLIKQIDRDVSYTNFDLPTTVTTPTIGSWTFRYGADHARVMKSNGTDKTVSIGGLYEKRLSSSGVKHVFHVEGTDGVAADIEYDEKFQTSTTRYLAGDRNGNVVLVTDGAGKQLAKLYYDPFGKRIDGYGDALVGSPPVSQGFASDHHDDEFGLIDMRGRVYDARRRRFLTPDPIVPLPTFGQSYNRYSYAFQNPVTFNDPDGFDPDVPGGAGGGPLEFVFSYSSAVVQGTLGGSAGASVRPSIGNGYPSPDTGPRPAPPTIKTNIEQYGAGVNEHGDSSPGCFHSKGGTAARPCNGPGDMGCTIDDLETKFLRYGDTVAKWLGGLSVLPITIYAIGGVGSAFFAGSAIDGSAMAATAGAFGLNGLWGGGRRMIDAVVEDDPLSFTLGLYEASALGGAFSDGGEGLGAGPRVKTRSTPARFIPEKTVADQGFVFGKQGGACKACGNQMTREPGPFQMHLDHPDNFAEYGPIHPRDSDGLCATCNVDKSTMDQLEWNLYHRGKY